MSILQAPELVLPALPTHAPVEYQCSRDDWVYVVARWPGSVYPQRFVWHIGESYWTDVALH